MKFARARTAPLVSLLVASLLPGVAVGAAGAAPPAAGRLWAGYQSADSPAQESRTPSVVLGTKEERAAKAAANYAQNRAVEAALGFEGLWKDFPAEIDFLFNAAASRFAAGHFAHALAYTRDYLATKTLGPEDRKEAEAQLREALAQTSAVAVTASLDPPGATEITVVAQHIPRESGDVRPELLFPTRSGGSVSLQLDPGFWTVRAQATGFKTAEQRVEVRKGQTGTVTLRLAPAPADTPSVNDPGGPRKPREVPPEVARRLKIAFGVTGGIVTAAGVGVTAAGAARVGGLGKAGECPEPPYSTCVERLGDAVFLRAGGGFVLGAGVGLLFGGLTWASKDAQTRKRVWIAGSVVGGLGLVAGIVLSNVFGSAFSERNDVNVIPDWGRYFNSDGKAPVHTVGYALAGFGAGAVVSSLTGLLVQRKYLRNVGGSAMLGRGLAGLSISGRF